VVDFRCELVDDRLLVDRLVFGEIGWLQRLGFRPVRSQTASWDRITEFGPDRIVLGSARADSK
jgi:hypothetical protein